MVAATWFMDTRAGGAANATGFFVPPPHHMKTQIPLTDAPGRVLQSVTISDDDDQIALVFYDGTFTILDVSYSYETLIVRPLEDDEEFNANHFGDTQLINSGIMTPEEVRAMRDAQRLHWDHIHEQRERAQYERLRAKYGGGAT